MVHAVLYLHLYVSKLTRFSIAGKKANEKVSSKEHMTWMDEAACMKQASTIITRNQQVATRYTRH